LGIIITVHEFGHFIAAKKSGVHVDEFSLGMGPLIYQFKPKDSETTYSLRALPIGGYVAMAEKYDKEAKIKKNRVLENKRFLNVFWVLVNGVVFNFLLAIVLFFIMGIFQGRPVDNTYIYNLAENYPAIETELQVGDEILKVNGVEIDSYYDFNVEVNAKEGKDKYTLTVKKEDGSIVDVTIDPVEEEIDGVLYRRFGIGFATRYEKGFLNALIYSVEGTIDTIVKIWDTLVMLFCGDISMDNLSGPVGMYSVIDTVKSQGIMNVIYILAYLSVNVGVLNLLPIPVFDGGRILILIIEKIIKRKTSEKLEEILNIVGFGLMILLMIVVTFNDIIRLW
jgi:regulator of sigma E protease